MLAHQFDSVHVALEHDIGYDNIEFRGLLKSFQRLRGRCEVLNLERHQLELAGCHQRGRRGVFDLQELASRE